MNSFAQFDAFVLGLERIGPFDEGTSHLHFTNVQRPLFTQKGTELIYHGKGNLESIKIVSVTGVAQEFSFSERRINLSRFSPGIYYLYSGQSVEAFEFKVGF